jgi:hypothetical protein
VSYERESGRLREQRPAIAASGHQDLPLFDSVSMMARRSDPATARQAAAGILRPLAGLQQRVYAAFLAHGAMTAKQAERLPEFADFGFSTVWKRVSELHRAGLLGHTGRRTEGAARSTQRLVSPGQDWPSAAKRWADDADCITP